MGNAAPEAYDSSNAETPITRPSSIHIQNEERATMSGGELAGAQSVPLFRAMRRSNFAQVRQRRNTQESSIPAIANTNSATPNARIPGNTAISSVRTR